LSEKPPNFLLLYGDRSETLTSAVVATHLQIPIIHLQGGDKSGSVDDWMRHAITKLSHLHYPSTEDSRNRILRLGEEPWRVEAVGDSHLDPIVRGEIATPEEFLDRFEINLSSPTLLILQHSETTEAGLSSIHMKETIQAVKEFPEFQKVLIYPCSDFGYEGIVNVIESCRGMDGFSIFENIEAPYFRCLIRESSAIIGNSSAGLIEAPSLGTPSVNIGRRQLGRLRGDSVIDTPHDAMEIVIAIKKAIELPRSREFDSPYSINLHETSAQKIIRHLNDSMSHDNLFGKIFYE
jgi:UDP-hydrolysing UDP-N-acetyl-D-glucosamine 2-epimerase